MLRFRSSPTPSAPPAPARPDPSAHLQTALERMYGAFESVPFDPEMVRSPGSVSDDDVIALGEPVESLPADLVARFVLKAGTTWGAPDDLRRLAPRALEMAADQALPLDRRLLWAKLQWAGWTSWPTYQVVTIRAFLLAEWERLLRADPRPAHVAHRWLREATAGIEDLEPFLDLWTELLNTTEPALHHRATTGHLVLLLTNSPLRPDLPQTTAQVLPGCPAQATQLADWLADDPVREALDQAVVLLAGTTDSKRVQLAADRLARYRARREATEQTTSDEG